MPSSAGVHIVVLVGVLLLGLAPVTVDGPPHLRELSELVELKPDATNAPILPKVESSSASASSPGSSSALSAPGRDGPSSASSMPVVHQRHQHIISNTPDATNPVQTILQPDLLRPARLTTTLPVPSMIRMASVQRAPQLTAPVLKSVVRPAAPPAPPAPPQPRLPKVQPAHVDTVPLTSATELADAPRLAAFPTTGRTFQPPQPPPPAPPAPARPSAPTLAAKAAPSPPSAKIPAGGPDDRNLLVVNAFEVESKLSEREIPAAEIHGRFEVTARPSLPEAPTTGGSSSSVGVASSGAANSGNGEGKGRASSTSAPGAGSAGGRGKGSGGGTTTVAGAGSGHGPGLGTGAGAGSGHSLNAGMGNGNGAANAGGAGSSPFPGMTIVGGIGDGVNGAPANGTVDPHDPHGAYGLTILSSGRSGGAVRDLGVFNDGPVYTVYLDVSKLGIHGGRWSLQYSAAREIRIAHPGVALTAPFPQDSRLPQLPPAAVTANVGRVVVVEANLKADGKLEALRVMESPDQRLNEGIVDSLTHWYFEPAAMGTEKVPVKVLVGIPISSAMADTGVSQQADQRIPAAAPRSSAQ